MFNNTIDVDINESDKNFSAASITSEEAKTKEILKRLDETSKIFGEEKF
jgi:hypothetical protein